MDNAAKPVIHGREGMMVGKGGVLLSSAPFGRLSYRVAFVQPTPAAPAAWGLCVALRPSLGLDFCTCLLSAFCSFLARPQVPANRMPPFTANSMQMQTLCSIIATGVHSNSQEAALNIRTKQIEKTISEGLRC